MNWLLIYHAKTVGWVSQLYGSKQKAKSAAEQMEQLGADFALVIDLEGFREEITSGRPVVGRVA